MQDKAQDCLRFEELLRRLELTDDEVDFCLNHPGACAIGVHTREAQTRTRNALLRWVESLGQRRERTT